MVKITRRNSSRFALFCLFICARSLCVANDAPNTLWFFNRSSKTVVLDEMDVSNQSAAHRVNSIRLEPGQKGAMGFWSGQAGYIAAEDASGQIPATASRLEFYNLAEQGNFIDVSYIDGRNVSMSVDDAMGHKKGEIVALIDHAPPAALVYDVQGRPSIAGWHDGGTIKGRMGAAYIQSHLPCGAAFVHPGDNEVASCHSIRLSNDLSHMFYVDIGDP